MLLFVSRLLQAYFSLFLSRSKSNSFDLIWSCSKSFLFFQVFWWSMFFSLPAVQLFGKAFMEESRQDLSSRGVFLWQLEEMLLMSPHILLLISSIFSKSLHLLAPLPASAGYLFGCGSPVVSQCLWLYSWSLPALSAFIFQSSKLLRSEQVGSLYLIRHPLPNVSAKESFASTASDCKIDLSILQRSNIAYIILFLENCSGQRLTALEPLHQESKSVHLYVSLQRPK